MARAKKTTKTDDRNWVEDYADGGKSIISIDQEIKESMRSYIDYALTERALPYIDGLKPVHRAILWCMWEGNMKSNHDYVKSAKVAADVIGAYHPHSPDAVYGAAAAMSRSRGDNSRCGACKLTLALCDFHGNVGASFEDGPAASRYTSMRLSPSGESCVRDTGSGAVFMEPTFDAKHTLPEVMPVRIPLLLINGSNGLAYGYNVSWQQHNPVEALNACLVRLANRKCSVQDIKDVMPGPDYPSGGIAFDRTDDGIDTAYATGFGNITLTSRYTITRNATRSRHLIDFYETPHGIPRSGDNSIIEGITQFANKHPEYGIVDVKNLSGGEHECLIEVSVKSSLNPEIVAAALIAPSSGTKLTQTMSYRQSAVIGSFEKSDMVDATGRSNMLRLTNPKPRDIGVVEYIDAFLDFRYACVVNACEYEKEKAEHRKHMIDGLLKALLDIDEVIAIVRKSQNADSAKNNLKKAFKLDDEQATYVLSIPLSRLTRSDKIQLETNAKKLEEEIKRLAKILSSKKNVMNEIKRQLEEELSKIDMPRRTTLVSADGKKIIAKGRENRDQMNQTKDIISAITGKVPTSGNGTAANGDAAVPAMSLTVEGNTSVYLSPDGKISQTSKKAPEYIQALTEIDMHSVILIVFENGNSLRVHAYELPLKPTLLSQKCAGIMDLGVDGAITDKFMALATSDGNVKVLKCDTLTKAEECPVISLSGKAKVLAARPIEDGSFFVFVSSAANLLRFPVSSVNPQGRTSGGVAGIKLTEGASVIYATIDTEDAILITATNKTIKQTLLAEFPPKGRGAQGVRCHKFLKGEEALSKAYVGQKPDAKGATLPKPAGRDASGTAAEGLDKVTFNEK